MIEKARRGAAFLVWYSQTSLPEVRFGLILHAWTKLSSSRCKHVLKKKKKKGGGRKMLIFILYLAF